MIIRTLFKLLKCTSRIICYKIESVLRRVFVRNKVSNFYFILLNINYCKIYKTMF